ncbi:helix-turn-helix domain-containing protein [Glutamicibacter soli]|uniref:helix-turn-helix domain-containing protein n=1 Tax=Glutamicibacter soli TaxID=453836 RepID=UPI003FD073A1
MTRPLDPAKQQEIVQLASSGMTRNEIAKKVGCAPATVSRWANRAGIEFDRSATQSAVAARQMDLKALRSEAALRTIRRVIQLDDMFYGITDIKDLRELAATVRDTSISHFNISRLDMEDDSLVEVKGQFRDFMSDIRENAAFIEWRDKQQILEQPEQPAIEPNHRQDEP